MDKPTLTHDRDAACFRYTAPDGYRFGGDLHEFVYQYDEGDRGVRKAAERDFAEREKAEPLTKCSDPECDWRHDS